MSADAAHKKGWQIFEVVFGLPFLIAFVLQWILPIHFPRGIFVFVFILIGSIFILAGLVIVTMARREFMVHRQPTDPGQSTTAIITAGVFSISRNPFYLGGVILLVGVSLAFDLPWVIILLLPAIIACHFILIVPEEKFLSARFGEEYHRYAASVHRWLGRK